MKDQQIILGKGDNLIHWLIESSYKQEEPK